MLTSFFMSYSHNDFLEMNALKDIIADLVFKAGHEARIWYDSKNLSVGGDYTDEIAREIKDCQCFVACISKSWLSSNYCMKEFMHAENNNREIIPVLLNGTTIEDIKINSVAEFNLGTRNIISMGSMDFRKKLAAKIEGNATSFISYGAESAFNGNGLNSISYTNDRQVLVCKFKDGSIANDTEVTVNDSQCAVITDGTKVCQVLDKGVYNVNLDALKSIYADEDGLDVTKLGIYFVDLGQWNMVKWGTSEKIEYKDPVYGATFAIGLGGTFGIAVVNPNKFISKMISTNSDIEYGNVAKFFRGVAYEKLKRVVREGINALNISILELEDRAELLADYIKREIGPLLDEYGVSLNSFDINRFVKPEEDENYQDIKKLGSRKISFDKMDLDIEMRMRMDEYERRKKAMDIMSESDALKYKRENEGYTYQEEHGIGN